MELCGCCRGVAQKATLNFNQQPVAALVTLAAAIVFANVGVVVGVILLKVCVIGAFLGSLVVINTAKSMHNYFFPSSPSDSD